jgi:copper(I)-binding protein
MLNRIIAVAAIMAAILATSAAAQDYTIGKIKIEQPWSRATPAGAKVAGGFMKITNIGTEPDRLVGGSLVDAGHVVVHEMAMVDNVMKMRELAGGLEIKPGQTIELKPGSFHVMFMDLKHQLKEGDKINGTLVFARAGTVNVEFTIRGMGAQGSMESKDGMAGSMGSMKK